MTLYRLNLLKDVTEHVKDDRNAKVTKVTRASGTIQILNLWDIHVDIMEEIGCKTQVDILF